MSKLTNEIQKNLIDWVNSHRYEITIPNFYWQQYEMDLMMIKLSGLVYEYEIKVSKADFKNDFKKSHGSLFGISKLSTKHEQIITGKRICNRFFFVVPADLVAVEDCPAYAGLIYYKDGRFEMVKNAPLLHRNKFNDYQHICQRIAQRELFARQNEREAKWHLKQANRTIEQLEKEINHPKNNK